MGLIIGKKYEFSKNDIFSHSSIPIGDRLDFAGAFAWCQGRRVLLPFYIGLTEAQHGGFMIWFELRKEDER